MTKNNMTYDVCSYTGVITSNRKGEKFDRIKIRGKKAKSRAGKIRKNQERTRQSKTEQDRTIKISIKEN